MTRVRALFGVAGVPMAVGLWLALTAPPDVLQGEYSRLINIHVPSLWLAFLAFGVTALGSVDVAHFEAIALGPTCRSLRRDRCSVHRHRD